MWAQRERVRGCARPSEVTQRRRVQVAVRDLSRSSCLTSVFTSWFAPQMAAQLPLLQSKQAGVRISAARRVEATALTCRHGDAGGRRYL